MIRIQTYHDKYKQSIADLILPIQQKEFQVQVTIEDQPDLQNIKQFYCQQAGNFWLALDNDKVVGTIGLIDIGNQQGVIRKMFVEKAYRGKELGIGQLLLDTLISWCRQNSIKEIYLGTIDHMLAALKFYTRNGFVEVKKDSLPPAFPIMKVDNKFYALMIPQNPDAAS